MEMGLSEGRKGEGGKGRAGGGGRKGRAGGRNRGEGVENGARAGNLKFLKTLLLHQACVFWCDPQLGDEGKLLAINMRRIF